VKQHHAKTHHAKRHYARRHHPKRAEKRRNVRAVALGSNLTPPPDRSGTAASAAGDSARVVLSAQSPHGLLPLVLIIGIGAGLLVAVLASRPALAAFSERRETVVFVGLLTAACIAIGLVLALLGS
jgi:hypothetical protein